MQQFQRPGEEGRIEKNHMGGPKKKIPSGKHTKNYGK
jgi:hypothetical protein